MIVLQIVSVIAVGLFSITQINSLIKHYKLKKQWKEEDTKKEEKSNYSPLIGIVAKKGLSLYMVCLTNSSISNTLS